jgi:DNA-binding GntR family transcriptional regulator
VEFLADIRKIYSNAKHVSEEIYLTLHKAIADDVIHSGDRLVDSVLAEQFVVSRAPVREAIKRLELDGFVACSQNYGFHVKKFSNKECYENSEALEQFNVMMVMLSIDRITQFDILRLNDNIAKTRVLPKDSPKETIKQLQDFHKIIAQSANNESLLQIYDSLYRKFIFILNHYEPKEVSAGVIDMHQQICDALKSKDQKLLYELASVHCSNTLAAMAKRYLG